MVSDDIFIQTNCQNDISMVTSGDALCLVSI